LENLLELITPLEAEGILGGYYSGSPIGPGASVNEILNYFGNLGFSFTEDKDGNYFYMPEGGSGIMLDEVIVFGYHGGNGSDYSEALINYLYTLVREEGSDYYVEDGLNKLLGYRKELMAPSIPVTLYIIDQSIEKSVGLIYSRITINHRVKAAKAVFTCN